MDNLTCHQIRQWYYCQRTPAHGRLLVCPTEDMVAVDYGDKIRVYSKRRAGAGHGIWPCLFEINEEILIDMD